MLPRERQRLRQVPPHRRRRLRVEQLLRQRQRLAEVPEELVLQRGERAAGEDALERRLGAAGPQAANAG
ncbi:MAG: hypothetical protein IT332_15425 [Ardenticatenales bacterium]|nr:hypothetical protein [Ardenticatenales bacterium]